MQSLNNSDDKSGSGIPSVLSCLSNVPEENINSVNSRYSSSMSADLGAAAVRSPYLLRSRTSRTSVERVPCTRCSRTFRGETGLKIHLSKSSCGKVVSPVIVGPCSAQQAPCPQSMSVPVPEVPLRVPVESVDSQVAFRDNIGSDAAKLQLEEEKIAIRWPAMKEVEKWRRFEQCVVEQLPTNAAWSSQLDLLQRVVYDEAKDLFGCVEPVVRRGKKKNRRELKLCQLRDEIRKVERAKRSAESFQAYAFDTLLHELREERKKVRRAENGRKRRKERCRLRKSFYKDPFKESKRMLSSSKPVALSVEKEVLDDYVKGVALDEERDVDLGELDGLPEQPTKLLDFDERSFSFAHFRRILQRKRPGSTPGPNRIPYTVYKKCPKIARFLFEIFSGVKRSRVVPLCWRVNDGIMIPKVDNPTASEIGDFRQIALLNVEGKLFWAMVADRLYDFLVTRNEFVSPRVQKGSMRKVAGCWEHTAMVWSALKDARKGKKDVAAIWLDLANAYGSVPHKLILFALRRYQVPEKWIELIMAYYDGLWGRTSASGVFSEWMRYERGIFAGCTISVVLFVAAFNVILEYVDVGGIARYRMDGGEQIELLRGFMDDVSILTSSVKSANVALKRTEKAISWARMKLKPAKSRSLVVVKGRSMNVQPFAVGELSADVAREEDIIPCLQRKPLRTLGRVYDASIRDTWSQDMVKEKLVSKLKMLNKSHARGIMKLWALHHVALMQVRWDLMVYEIPLSFVEALEKSVSKYIRLWLGVSRSLSSVALYSKKSPIKLPFTSLVGLYKSAKVNAHLQLKESAHDEVRANAIPAETGRKWKLYDPRTVFGVTVDFGAIRRADRRLSCASMLGPVAQGRMGVEFAGGQDGKRVEQLTERRKKVKCLEEEREEEYLAEAVRQSVQCSWLGWCNYNQRVMSWRSLVYGDPKLFRFCLGATFNTLASPANLKKWGMAESDECKLCGQKCTVNHVLSGCRLGALVQGRYRYRHDCVLRVIGHHIALLIKGVKGTSGEWVHFVVEGASDGTRGRARRSAGVLRSADDWVLLLDLGKQLRFPEHIAQTSLRPDVVLYSAFSKTVVMVELTVPGEARFEVSQERKLNKYQDLKVDCERNG